MQIGIIGAESIGAESIGGTLTRKLVAVPHAVKLAGSKGLEKIPESAEWTCSAKVERHWLSR